jgi:predicted DNA binding CopG/RHH family protein
MNPQVPNDEEELEILQAWNAGLLKPVSNMTQQMTAHRAVADATFKKDQRLNIRISSRDLKSLQARALEEGIPYQTFAASLLHKFVSGHLVDQRGQLGLDSN